MLISSSLLFLVYCLRRVIGSYCSVISLRQFLLWAFNHTQCTRFRNSYRKVLVWPVIVVCGIGICCRAIIRCGIGVAREVKDAHTCVFWYVYCMQSHCQHTQVYKRARMKANMLQAHTTSTYTLMRIRTRSRTHSHSSRVYLQCPPRMEAFFSSLTCGSNDIPLG